ncbi:hypothetical protein EPUS_09331 [Endocarpon pusillum Z07020]|uniref:Uncharacterized protein n=1 Tax=Endocarpon pusillum (strain Z07020 / HMAS-L-300199) TaxID=1263415 RepID=U1G270_ENDPU|nr:uncharacterized protein EPUS_09331 [Endocarpon pusillum Z07020]ERF71367.1 hypothetical protein EPUS_09331 [Endocarpon pusillum Z07020]
MATGLIFAPFSVDLVQDEKMQADMPSLFAKLREHREGLASTTRSVDVDNGGPQQKGEEDEERSLHAAQINGVMIEWHRNMKWTTRPIYSSSKGSDSVPRKAETHQSTQVELTGEEGYRSGKMGRFSTS